MISGMVKRTPYSGLVICSDSDYSGIGGVVSYY
jgi:hypothetical protein